MKKNIIGLIIPIIISFSLIGCSVTDTKNTNKEEIAPVEETIVVKEKTYDNNSLKAVLNSNFNSDNYYSYSKYNSSKSNYDSVIAQNNKTLYYKLSRNAIGQLEYYFDNEKDIIYDILTLNKLGYCLNYGIDYEKNKDQTMIQIYTNNAANTENLRQIDVENIYCALDYFRIYDKSIYTKMNDKTKTIGDFIELNTNYLNNHLMINDFDDIEIVNQYFSEEDNANIVECIGSAETVYSTYYDAENDIEYRIENAEKYSDELEVKSEIRQNTKFKIYIRNDVVDLIEGSYIKDSTGYDGTFEIEKVNDFEIEDYTIEKAECNTNNKKAEQYYVFFEDIIKKNL